MDNWKAIYVELGCSLLNLGLYLRKWWRKCKLCRWNLQICPVCTHYIVNSKKGENNKKKTQINYSYDIQKLSSNSVKMSHMPHNWWMNEMPTCLHCFTSISLNINKIYYSTSMWKLHLQEPVVKYLLAACSILNLHMWFFSSSHFVCKTNLVLR